MSFTYNDAIDEMQTVMKEAWEAASLAANRILYEDLTDAQSPGARPTGHAPWARVVIRQVDAGQASLGGRGRRRWSRSGVFMAQVFTEIGRGLSGARATARIVTEAFEGAATPGGVWFRNVRATEVGADGGFVQVNVVIEFTYDEVR